MPSVIDVVLHHPEIPQNTGNAMRLAANSGATLHLVEPLGFDLDDAKLRRAGLDYRDKATVRVHPDLEEWRRRTSPREGLRDERPGAGPLHGRRLRAR